jgi:hypothetical protein
MRCKEFLVDAELARQVRHLRGFVDMRHWHLPCP